MSDLLESNLGRALSIRLEMQVSLSSLPVVEEWMDIHLTRWLESVPLPPELPMGHEARFGVVLASDLSRLRWEAYGHPDGFIPKLVEYLQTCKMSGDDARLLDEMGNQLEPALVGSWITVMAGGTGTGWQFCDEHDFARVADLFGDHDGKRRLTGWLADAGITRFRRFAQSIGKEVFSEVEFSLPGVAIDDQLTRVAKAFQHLCDAPLPDPVAAAMSTALSPGLTVAVSIHGGAVAKVSVLCPGLGNDVIAQLCGELGIGFDNDLARLQGMLGAEASDRVEYSRVLSGGADVQWVDVHVIPTGSQIALPGDFN